MSLYAWTNSETPDQLAAAESTFPGLGFVLKPKNYATVRYRLVPPIAYVNSLAHAEVVADWARAGFAWHAAIVNDERNAPGPSGSYMTPEEYRAQFEPIRDTLQNAGVKVSTMGLQPIGTWWHELLRARTFDHDYHRQLPDADLRAFNANKTRLAEVHRVLRLPGPWVLSPAPFRTAWDRLWEPVSVQQWARVAEHPHVRAVALWCLTEVQEGGGRWQREHGLLDRHGNITNVGREVRSALEAP